MNVDIIHSGSSGNCAVIDDTIIIDAGWNCTSNGRYVLLTHHHTDHTKFLDKLGGLPVYCTQETADKLVEKFPYVAFNIIEPGKRLDLETYHVVPFLLNHDAPCVGYEVFNNDYSECILFATDFNSFETETEKRFIRKLKNKEYDALYIECNNTLTAGDFDDVYFGEGKPPRDEFHRRKSFQNHCNVGYLRSLFERAGYSATNRYAEPVTLLHKSSFYYQQNVDSIVELCKVANVINPLL